MNNDLISRQAAMDALNHELRCGAVINQCGLEVAYEVIEGLSPAQPEGVMPVKCRECVYRIKMKYNSKFDCEKGHGVNWTEFYCADGRRERDD